jgi:hypothetical protein
VIEEEIEARLRRLVIVELEQSGLLDALRRPGAHVPAMRDDGDLGREVAVVGDSRLGHMEVPVRRDIHLEQTEAHLGVEL